MSLRGVALSATLATVLTPASTLALAACEGASPEFCGGCSIGAAIVNLSRHENGVRFSRSGSVDSDARANIITRTKILDFDEESMQPEARVQPYVEFEDELTRHEAIHKMIVNETDDFDFDETDPTYDARGASAGFRIKF